MPMPENGDTSSAPELPGLEAQLHEQLSDAVMHLAEIDATAPIVEVKKPDAKKFHLPHRAHAPEKEGHESETEVREKGKTAEEEEGAASPFSDAVTDTLGGVFASISYVLIGAVILVAIGGGLWAWLGHRETGEEPDAAKFSVSRPHVVSDRDGAGEMADPPASRPAETVGRESAVEAGKNAADGAANTPRSASVPSIPQTGKAASRPGAGSLRGTFASKTPSKTASAVKKPQAPLSAPLSPKAAKPLSRPAPGKKAQLSKLWRQGVEAKQRRDYATARRAWTAALRLDPGHPGFQESIDKLPR